MKYLLDTDICVYWLNGNKAIEKKAMHVGLGNIAISFITLSELYYGAYKSQKLNQNLEALKNLESKLTKINSNKKICSEFGKLKSELEREGQIIDDADLFIACCAQETNRVMVTNNEKHFHRITGLKVENWAQKSGC
jgi:tRNA(fMet)-specific endonuclease VapC